MTEVLRTDKSEALHRRARLVLPMGVTGTERYATPFPLAFAHAEGKWLTDIDGNVYLDYHGGFGTAILGYAHPEVDAAVERAVRDVGAFVGVPNPHEVYVAERLSSVVPGADKIALCGGGGSDAVYHAIRVSRAATGRTKILKVEGGYHGWHSEVGVSTRPVLDDTSDAGILKGIPNTAGALQAVLDEVLVVTVNNEEALSRIFSERGKEIAAFIVEPALYSAGCIPVKKSYLELARRLCTAHSSVLIFDEVLSGFRNGLQGAGAAAGVVADLIVFGKAIANGYIMSLLAGRAELMAYLAPEGPVFYSGTFNGHPISLAAAMTTMDVVEREDIPRYLSELGDELARGVNDAIRDLRVEAVCQAHGSVWSVYFKTRSVENYRDYAKSLGTTTERLYEDFRLFLRQRGIYIAKRHAPRAFLSSRHDVHDVERTVNAIAEFLLMYRNDLVPDPAQEEAGASGERLVTRPQSRGGGIRSC